MVTLLIENRANIEHSASMGEKTALMHACLEGHYLVAEYLLKKGANVNTRTNQSEEFSDTTSPLAFEVAHFGRGEILELLTYWGADLLCGPKNISYNTISVLEYVGYKETHKKKMLPYLKQGLEKRAAWIKECLRSVFSPIENIFVEIANIISSYSDPTTTLDPTQIAQLTECDTELPTFLEEEL
ncbi:hypothetical protein RFI_32898 [Reticulomyxa filosa]|uniref:Uncharacterized protein n=1 Tax=Reticulomyxa filosa TaxID=46433 RepID=X6LS93_RETFI|nr:hypothetical protein RFI_32898 [Reticulomyxa filosa]|eukprot:ETO04499.1 hypothetical protein RFI_32898 [Reticulomyxa filosa]